MMEAKQKKQPPPPPKKKKSPHKRTLPSNKMFFTNYSGNGQSYFPGERQLTTQVVSLNTTVNNKVMSTGKKGRRQGKIKHEPM